MTFSDLTLPGVIGDLHFGINVLTGWDQLREVFTPHATFLDYLARRIAKEVRNADPSKRITFTYAGETYEVVRLGKFASARPWRGGGAE